MRTLDKAGKDGGLGGIHVIAVQLAFVRGRGAEPFFLEAILGEKTAREADLAQGETCHVSAQH